MNRMLVIEEARRLLSERTFIAACLLLAVLAAYATWSGQHWQTQRVSAFISQTQLLQDATLRESQQIRALERGEATLAEAAAAGLPQLARTELHLPPIATAGLAIGDAELRATHATISATTRRHEMFRFQEVDNPILLGWGRFDLAFLVVVLLPLFLLGLTCTCLSREHDNGTLRMLLSHPVTARRLALVRVGLRCVALIGAIILGATLVMLWPDPPLMASEFVERTAATAGESTDEISSLWRVALFAMAAFFYLVFWSALALWIIARNQSSEQNSLLWVLIWIFWVLVVPAASSFVTKLSSPIPSRLEYITTARAAENNANQQGRALLEQYLLDHPELEATRGEAVAPFIKTFVLVQRQVDDAVAPVVDRFRTAENAQQNVADMLRWLSPRDLIERNLLMTSGHDPRRFTRFEQQAESLRANWQAAVEEPLIAGRRLTSEEFDNLPRSPFQEQRLSAILGEYAAHLLVLLLITLIFLVPAIRRLGRFTPVIETES